MRRMRSVVCAMAVAGLLSLVGCNGAPGDSTDVKKLQADLKDANGRNEVLRKDNDKLSEALKQSESARADVSDARNKLQVQVDDLTKSRDEMTVKVSELGVARTELQAKVEELTKKVDSLTTARDGLEKQVGDLTKARNVALEDARSAQGKVEQLGNKLKVQTQQMAELQEQIVNIRTVLDHLQQNLQ
jgi:chromosome segregation ATPase